MLLRLEDTLHDTVHEQQCVTTKISGRTGTDATIHIMNNSRSSVFFILKKQ